MTDPNAFTKLVPGFDFLQGLVKNAGAAMPNVGQWIAPTLNPEELEKRIEELRTVQFWLEQNARMLGATIQALEVQRMTLSTLKTMNLSMGELRDALTLRPPEAGAGASASAAEPAPGAAASAAAQPARKKKSGAKPAKGGTGTTAVPGVVDPMQWWGALTKQFTQLAANAMKDNASDAAKSLAGTMVKQSFDAAGQTLKKAVAVPTAVAKTAAGAARTAAAGSRAARKRAATAARPKR